MLIKISEKRSPLLTNFRPETYDLFSSHWIHHQYKCQRFLPKIISPLKGAFNINVKMDFIKFWKATVTIMQAVVPMCLILSSTLLIFIQGDVNKWFGLKNLFKIKYKKVHNCRKNQFHSIFGIKSLTKNYKTLTIKL